MPDFPKCSPRGKLPEVNKEKLLRAEPGGFAGFTFVAVDAVEARGADAEAGCDAEPAVHAARNTQG